MSIGLWYLPEPSLGGHVVAGADALGVLAALAGSDQLGQAVVTDLDDALFHEEVGRLEVAVDDAVIVKVGDSFDQPLEPVREPRPAAVPRDTASGRWPGWGRRRIP